MPQAMYNCVDRKRFNLRLIDATKKAQKRLASLAAQCNTGPYEFAYYAGDVIAENAWLAVLAHVSSAKPRTSVESVQIFALGEVLRRASNPRADRDQLCAWAKIVELTRPGSMQTSK